jgi:radical SAM protein with 4Fe4S-binding SPASM domain
MTKKSIKNRPDSVKPVDSEYIRNLPRFRARREYFGSLILDCDKHEVLPFDAISTAIIESLEKYELTLVKSAFEPYISENDIDEFVQLWRKNGLLDDSYKFTGIFLPDISQKDFLSAPLRIYIDFTAECNLRCRHCVSSSTEALEGELTTDEMKSLFEELAGLGVTELNVGGGEPLLRKDACELLRYASSLGMSVSINTNATVIDEKLSKELATVNFDKFNISLEGGTREIHDYNRGKGSFDKVMRGIDILSKNTKHKLNLDFTITKYNAPYIDSFFNLTECLPVNSMCAGFIRPQGRAAVNMELLLTAEEQKILIEKIENLKEGFSKPVWSKILLPECSDEDSGRLYKTFGCGAAQVACQINAVGNMSPCNFFGDLFKKDNIRDKSVLEIWCNNPFFIKLRNLQGNDKCMTCGFYNHCRGGCRAQAYFHTGDLNAPDYLCFIE